MNSITKTDYAKAKDISMSELLKSYSIYPKNKMYSCLFHQDKTPSSSIGNKNKLYCFSCQRTSSTIDVVMQLEGCDEFTAIKKLLNNKTSSVAKNISVLKYKPIKYDYNFGLNISKTLNNHNISFIKSYLDKRCILNVLDVANNLGVEIRHNYYKGKNYIFYNFLNYNFIVQKAVDGSSKKNFGSPIPTYFQVNKSSEWYICEGIEDCLSLVLTHNFNVVCLNSISNLDKFLSQISTKNTYIIATDNDASGKKVKRILIKELRTLNIKVKPYTKFYDFAEKYSLKDINECFMYKKEMKKNENYTI